MSQDILIAGCGRIGARLGRHLAGQGHSVHGIRRRAEPLPQPLRTIRADLRDPALPGRLPERVDRVYIILTPGAFDEAAYRAAYIDATASLLVALRRRGLAPGHVVMISSTSVYGQNDGEWVDEESVTAPDRFSGRILLESEDLIHASPFPATVVRCAGIYGPGRDRLLQRVRAATPCPAYPPTYTNRIHEDDVVGFLAHLSTMDDARQRYLAADDDPAPRHEVMNWLAERLGVSPPELTINHDGRNKRCRNGRLAASGYRLSFRSYRDGYAAMLDGA